MNHPLHTTTRLTTALALAFSALPPSGARAAIPPATVAATQSAVLVNDVDGDGLADPGDTLRYTAIVSNTGGVTATGVAFTETLDANTSPTGLLQASPIASGDRYTAGNVAPLVVSAGVGLLSNDFGVPGPSAAVTSTATAQGGTASISADGAFVYTAAPGFSGTDTFTYTISNAVGDDAGLVTLTVWALPQAQPEGYTTLLDTPLNVAAASGLLVNDAVSGGTLTAYAATSAQGGSVTVNTDGSFSYMPAGGFFSPPVDTFTYTLVNPVGSSTGTVSITVDLPGPPLAVTDTYTATANASLTIPAAGVLTNDTLSGAVIDAYAATTDEGGSVVLAPTGAFTYTPPVDFVSPPTDAFTYTLHNALGTSTATVNLAVVPAGAPSAAADAFTTTANLTFTVGAGGGLLANDTRQLATLSPLTTTTALGGLVTVDPDGAFVYLPPTDTISPPADTFTYTLTNALGSSTATVTLTIHPPAAPSVADDAYTATADTDLVINAASGALLNDTLNFGAIADYAATTTRGGSVILAASGAFTYTPPAGLVSPPVDAFTYTVANPLGDATATVRITINPPGAPLTIGESYTATVNTDLVIAAGGGVLANDTLNYGTLADFSATTPRGGSVDLAPTGAFTYTPPIDTVSPPTDTFTYTVTNTLGTSTGTVTLTIAPEGAPGATADTYTATANTQLVVAAGSGLFANDIVHFATLTGYAATTARGGSVVLAQTGAFTYTPPIDTVSPPTDTFTYTLSNLLGASTGTVTLTIDPPAPPVAAGDAYTATVNVAGSVVAPGVLGNDTLNFGALTAYAATSAQGGTVSLAPNGAFTYTSALNLLGTDTYTYTLSNALGASTATVTVTVLPPPPDAVNDAYSATGNVDLSIGAGSGVLGNDSVNFGTLTGASTTSAQGGSVTVNTDGSFSYNPPTGFTGTDTFTYTVGNATAVDTATVTVTVSQRVWFVDNTAAVGGDGRHSAPFDTLAEAQTASTTGDILYVYYGDGTTAGQNAGITLKAGQHLLGQHVALVVNGTTIEPAVPGDRPAISAGSGNTITAPTGTGVEVRGFRLSGGASGDLLGLTTSGSANADLTVSDTVFTAAGNSGIDIAHSGSGTLTVSLSDNVFNGGSPALRIVRNTGTAYLTTFRNQSFDGSVAGDAVQITGVTFDATPGGAFNTVSAGALSIGASGDGVNGAGVVLTNVAGDLSVDTLAVYTAGGAGLSASGTTAYTGSAGFRLTANSGSGVIAAAGGPAVSAATASLDLQLSTLSSTGSSTTGVALTAVAGTFTAGAGSTISTASGTDFFVDGGSGTVTYSGTITNTAGRSVVVSNRTGGTHAFTGAISDTGTGIQLLNNTGATLAFSGGLTLNTGANAAFTATGGGTVTVTGSTNTLQTTTGTALNVANTTIGAAGLTFRSVSANGAVNGIVLNATGASGGLTVAGAGSAASGGTIQNTTGAGISLTSVTGVGLAYMAITGGADDGVNASGVTNFSLSHATVSGNGNSVTDEGLELDNVTGTVTLDTVTITGSAHNNVWVDNTGGTLTAFTVTNGAYQNTSAVSGAHGLLLTARGTATVGAVSITGASITGNFGSGVFIDAADTATIGDALIQNVTLTSNANALTLSQSGSAAQNFRVLNNTLSGAQTHAINVYSSGTATGGSLNGRIVGNTIGSAGTVGSGSATGDGIRARIQAQTNGVLLINSNIIRQTPNGTGIEVVGGSDSLDVTITGNNVDPQATSGSPLAAIYVTAANPTGSQNGFVRSDVTGNTVSTQTNSIDGGGEYLVLVEESGTTLQLRNTTGAADATAQLVNANTGSAGAYSMDNTVDLIGTAIGLPPLRAADGQGPGAEAVTAAQFETVHAEAVDLWAAAGQDVAGLPTARLVVADLPDDRLAEVDADAATITLDVDAAGWGWSFDDPPAEGRIDALTVVAHELGHLLGFEHVETGVMAETLARGKRVTPAPALDAAADGAVGVVIGTLPAGRSVTIVFDAIVSDPVTGGASTVSNQGTVSGVNFAAFVTDDPATPAVDDATVTALDLGRFLYLPVIERNDTPRPDLTVIVSLSPNTSTFAASDPVLITVVVTNIGKIPAAGFWVDAYLNPTTAPTTANQVWNERCGLTPCYGLAWSVPQSLAPGQSVTLLSTPGGPYADNTIWPGHFAAGTTDLYVYVDSYSDDGGPTGQINELNESNNRVELHGLSVTGDAPAETIDAVRLPGR